VKGGIARRGSKLHPELQRFSGNVTRCNDDGTFELSIHIPGSAFQKFFTAKPHHLIRGVQFGEGAGQFVKANPIRLAGLPCVFRVAENETEPAVPRPHASPPPAGARSCRYHPEITEFAATLVLYHEKEDVADLLIRIPHGPTPYFSTEPK